MAHFQYSFPESGLKPTDEKLLYISSATYDTDWVSLYHSHSFAELIYVTNGNGYFCTETEDVPVCKDSLILINPNLRHTEKSSAEHPLTYIVLGIDNIHFNFKDEEFCTYKVQNLSKHRDAYLPLLKMMLEEVRTHRESSDAICQYFLHILLLKMSRTTGDQFTPYSAKNIPAECETIKNYMDTHYHENITLDTIAEVSHLNKYYLSHIFSKAFGISPITYLLERRILNSKQLLKSSDYNITQIAHMTGFSSANYFSQSFKRSTGMTPAAYRKIHHL